MESRQGRIVNINRLEGGVVRFIEAEMNDVRTTCTTLRTDGDLIFSVQTSRFCFADGLELRTLQFVRHLGKGCRAFREVNIVVVRLGVKFDVETGNRERFEGVVIEGLDGERDLIDCGASVTGGDGNTCFSVHACGRDRDRLELIAGDSHDLREFSCSFGQGI